MFLLKPGDVVDRFIARIEYRDDDPFRFWNTGEVLESLPTTPLEATVLTDPRSCLAVLWETPLPLLHRRLHTTLVELGVDNLETWPVTLIDARSGARYHDWLAFNVVGVVAGGPVGGLHRMLSPVEGLVVDEQVWAGLLLAGFGAPVRDEATGATMAGLEVVSLP